MRESHGNKSGVYRVYDENKTLKKVLSYKHGRLHGVCKGYYNNGSLKWKVSYRRGKKHGEQRIYYLNGRLYSTGIYRNGQLNGKVRHYTKNGYLKYTIFMDRGDFTGRVINHIYPKTGFVSSRHKYISRVSREPNMGHLPYESFSNKGFSKDFSKLDNASKTANSLKDNIALENSSKELSPTEKKLYSSGINAQSRDAFSLEETQRVSQSNHLREGDKFFKDDFLKSNKAGFSKDEIENVTRRVNDAFDTTFPKTGIRDLESWKVDSLLNNYDYEELIKEGTLD